MPLAGPAGRRPAAYRSPAPPGPALALRAHVQLKWSSTGFMPASSSAVSHKLRLPEQG